MNKPSVLGFRREKSVLDVSPYLLRPLRSLEEARRERQRAASADHGEPADSRREALALGDSRKD